MTIQPVTYTLVVYQGATFEQIFIWKNSVGDPIDLTGYTARMMARANVETQTPFIDLTTENGGIALGGAAGTITIYIPAAGTAAINNTSGVYDLELESSGGEVTRFLQGNIILSREVTR